LGEHLAAGGVLVGLGQAELAVVRLDLRAVEQPGETTACANRLSSLALAMCASVSLRPGTSGRQYNTTR